MATRAETMGTVFKVADKDWALVKEFTLSYHNKETTLLCTIAPYYGNLNYVP